MTLNEKNLTDEFNEFLSASELVPPVMAREAILARVNRDLNPPSQNVFLKMLGVHAVVSLFSLSICSQFGVQSLRLYDAMESMMTVVGGTYCMAFCGLLYLGLSALALSLFLNPEEIKVIRRHQILQFTLLTGVSLGVFLCLGAKVLLFPGTLWIAGSLVGGISTLELGWMLRSKFRRQLVFGI
jgi:hypothetical protein